MAAKFRLLALLACVLCAHTATGQGTGSISGVVTDQDGAAMPGVIVTAHGVDQGLLMKTGPDGRYTLPALISGRYVITAALDGFGTVVRSGVWVRVGKTSTLPLVMAVVRTTESVTVTAPRRRRQALNDEHLEAPQAVLPSRNPVARFPFFSAVSPVTVD